MRNKEAKKKDQSKNSNRIKRKGHGNPYKKDDIV